MADMVIHKIELYLKGKKEAEIVGVVLDDVLAEADVLIAHWLSTGYAEADYLAMVTSGGSYRYEQRVIFTGGLAYAGVLPESEFNDLIEKIMSTSDSVTNPNEIQMPC